MEHQKFLVTICIPFFNAEKYLEIAIQSVLNQTFHDWKLLLINDGSTDTSLDIAMKYQEDSRVTIISDGQNKNLVFRLNQLPNLVDTKYLARMDADDIMMPEKMEKQLKILESHPEIDVLGTNAYSIDENNLVNGIRFKFKREVQLRKVLSFIHPTIIAKTEWFKINQYDDKAIRIEDAELWLRTSSKYNFQILNEPLFFYREIGTDYYKKYFKGFVSVLYLMKKYNYNMECLLFGIKYISTGLVYYLYGIIGKENVLVSNRNELKFRSQSVEEVLNKIHE
jgi:glycosyltransferase involved in cell wall biosynthesis